MQRRLQPFRSHNFTALTSFITLIFSILFAKLFLIKLNVNILKVGNNSVTP